VTEQPGDRRYTRAHEWAKQEGGRTLVGITDYAQEQLGDVVYVGLPEAGTEVEAGTPLGEVESTKSVSDIYSPVSGKVVEKNAEVEQNPEIVNAEP
jgi:glycine cleavage system H protein